MSGITVLGIDPGIATTGIGLVREEGNSLKALYYGCISTRAGEETTTRLINIKNEIKFLLDKYRPNEVAIEQLFFNNNAKTAFAVGQAKGVLILTAGEAGYAVTEYTPLQVKMAVAGTGGAEKFQVQQMVKSLLGLATIPKPDDAADALAIAICHIHSYKFKRRTEMAKV